MSAGNSGLLRLAGRWIPHEGGPILLNRMAVDALRMPFYSSRHPEGRMFREISLIWEIRINRKYHALKLKHLPSYPVRGGEPW